MQKELQLLGLTENEAAVYEALVTLGPCKASALIARLDIHRTIIYRCLEAMAANGFITKIVRNGVWHFQIADPQSFMVSTKRRELVLGELAQQIAEVGERAQSQIVVYEGVPSYRNYWLESIKRFPDGTVDYIAGGELDRWQKLMGSAADEYLKIAKKKRLVWKTLYFNELTSIELAGLRNAPLPVECRVWEPADAGFVGNFNVIHDTVILHSPSENPKIIEIRDKAQVKMFKGLFDLVWAKATPVTL